MEDFFKQFRDNLERRPPPPFEKQDWLDLEKRLGQQDKKRPVALILVWLAWPLLFLSLGANALFFFQLEKGNSRIASSETSRDTVFLTQTIFKTDTIYQNRFVQTALLSFPSSATDVHDKIKTPWQAAHLMEPSTAEGFSSNIQNQLLENSSALSNTSPFSLLHPLSSLPHRVPHTVHRTLAVPLHPVEPAISKPKKTLQYHLSQLRPKGFRLGLTGGWTYPFSKGLKSQGGLSLGAEAAVEFSPRLRMWGSTAYYRARFVTDRMGDDIGIPVAIPPSDDFDFTEAEAPQPSWEYGIGLQYSVSTSRKFRPFLGAGWGAVSLLPYEIVYDFKNKALGVEWSLEKTVNRREFLTNLLLLRAGFESEFSKKWNWQLRASYRAGFNKTGFQTPDMFGLQVGLTRRF